MPGQCIPCLWMVPGKRGEEVQLLDSASQPGRPANFSLLTVIGASMAQKECRSQHTEALKRERDRTAVAARLRGVCGGRGQVRGFAEGPSL